MAQTAVEWLFEEITGLKVKSNFELFKKDLEKAKAMEKDNIVKAFNEGMLNSVDYFGNGVDEAEQYYNEKYNQ
jgi:molecular chaperone GrpE (heat shock protein)